MNEKLVSDSENDDSDNEKDEEAGKMKRGMSFGGDKNQADILKELLESKLKGKVSYKDEDDDEDI